MARSRDFASFALDEWLEAHEWKAKYQIATSAIPGITPKELGVDLSGIELGYGEAAGSPALYKELAAYEGVPEERVAVTAAGSEANFLAAMALLSAGDKVLVETPTYQQLAEVPGFLGVQVRRAKRTFENDWRFDLDEVRRGFKAGARALIFANPNNPTGRSLAEREVKALADIAAEHDGFLLVDEIFRELTFDALRPAHEIAENIHATNSLSKCFGLGGVRIGWFVGSSQAAAEVRRVKGYTSSTPPALSQAVAVAALKDRDRLLARAQKIRDENFGVLRSFVAASPALSWREPSGGIICALRLPAGLDDEAFATRLVRERGTLVAPGRFFGIPGFLRVGYGTERRALEAGLDELEALATS